MTAWLAILISMAFVIGSWLWLMPSVHQKKIAQMRQRASMAGFGIKFISPEQYRKIAGREWVERQALPARQQIVRYSKSIPRSGGSCHYQLLFSQQAEALVFKRNEQALDASAWSPYQLWLDAASACQRELEGLLAISWQQGEGKADICFYWTEQGDLRKVNFEHQCFSIFTAQEAL